MEVQLLRTKNGLVMVRSNHPEDWKEVGPYGAKDAQLIATANDPRQIMHDLRSTENRKAWRIPEGSVSVSMPQCLLDKCSGDADRRRMLTMDDDVPPDIREDIVRSTPTAQPATL